MSDAPRTELSAKRGQSEAAPHSSSRGVMDHLRGADKIPTPPGANAPSPRRSIFGPQADGGTPVTSRRHTPPVADMSAKMGPKTTKGPINETPRSHKTPKARRETRVSSPDPTVSESEDSSEGLVNGKGVTDGDSQLVFEGNSVAKTSEVYKGKSVKKSEGKAGIPEMSDEDLDSAMDESMKAVSTSPMLNSRDIARKVAAISVGNRKDNKRQNKIADESVTTPSKRPKHSQEDDTTSDLDEIKVKSPKTKKTTPKKVQSESQNTASSGDDRGQSSAMKEKESRRDSMVTAKDNHRALGSEQHTETLLAGGPLRVLLSSSDVVNDNRCMDWLEYTGVRVIEELPNRRANFVCVVGKDLKRTAKVLRSLALGKMVLIDKWITDSVDKGELQDQKKYIHPEIVAAIDRDRSGMYADQTLFFTNGLKSKYGKGWFDIQHLARDIGAKEVEYGAASKGSKIEGEVVYFGVDSGDKDAIALVQQYGKTVYHRDMLTQSVLDGDVDLESNQHQLVREKKQTPRKALKSKASKHKS